MEFISNIKKETLIICNNYTKENILKLGKLLPIKIMNVNELKEQYFFSYDENAIIYLTKKYHIKYEIAKEYIESLYYIEDKDYNNEKLKFLISIKKELDDNNLLNKNKEFKNYLKRVDILVYNLPIDKYIKRILKQYKYKEEQEKNKNYEHTIYEFNTMEEEVNYIASSISEKIASGIDPNKIKLMNIDESYYNAIHRIFTLYNLLPGIKYKRPLSSYQIIKDFISYYQNYSLTESIAKLDTSNHIYDELINLINKYIKYDSKELIMYKLEHTYIESDTYTNEIELIDYLEYQTKDDEYYYMINFNEGNIPKSYLDTAYLTDNIKEVLGLETSKEKNQLLRNNTLQKIKNTKNLIITYKLSDNSKTYYASSLSEYFKIEKIKQDYSISYSKEYNQIKLVNEYDNYLKFGVKSSIFDILNNNYDISYNNFLNKYTKINRAHEKLNLSYSKLQIYNKCAFRYYLTDILKLDIYEENFSAVIGSMVHFVLEKCLSNNDYDIEKYVSIFLKDKILSKKEQFFLDKYKKEIKILLDQIQLEKEYSSLNEAMYEKKLDIDLGDNTHFIGIIDKILYLKDDRHTYIAIVDYKTGMDDISLKYLKYGLNIQLPIYLFLVSHIGFENPKYVGFYLQKFNITDKDYRLFGYSNSDKSIISKLDNNYENSKIIKGLKSLKDGSFAKTSKILDDSEIELIKEAVNNVIKNTINNIKNNNFEINPKVTEDKNIGCEYCKFNDICFKTKQDESLIIVKGDEQHEFY